MLKRFLQHQIDLSRRREFHYFFLWFSLNLIVATVLAIIYRPISIYVHEYIVFVDRSYVSILLGVVMFPIVMIGIFLSTLAFRSWAGIFGMTINIIENLIDDVKLFLE